MKIDKIEVFNVSAALRGMRNPTNSWYESDSTPVSLGDSDLEFAHKLIEAGDCHRPFMKQIIVSMDITAPLYWWADFDTYNIDAVVSPIYKPIAFSDIDVDCDGIILDKSILEHCEHYRKLYFDYNVHEDSNYRRISKEYFDTLTRTLPDSYLQTCTVTLSFESIYRMRNAANLIDEHKLPEWNSFLDVMRGIPYAADLIFF